jgi:hypothetical protein
MRPALAAVKLLRVPRRVVAETWRALRMFGGEGNEGLVLWLGRIDATSATIVAALSPPQASIRNETGVGYFVTSETLFELNRSLHRTGLRLIAQVHSHPTEAYHSDTDDAYAIVTADGGFSIVVPDFAAEPPDPRICAFYRLRGGAWMELAWREVERIVDWNCPDPAPAESA